LVGPFKKAKGGFTHIFVAVDKFTKWVEAKPAASITAAKAVEFIKETMYRFVIPNNIITIMGKSNGHVERSNGMILQGLKPRIFDRLKPYAARWVKELPSVLWALGTTLSRATDHTPFSLVYGSEAMLPIEVERKSFRVQHFNEGRSDDSRVDDLTRLEELCKVAVI
jgi:hypothetical protein